MDIEPIEKEDIIIPHVIEKDEDGIFHAFIDRLKDKSNISLNNFYRNVNTLISKPVDNPDDMPNPNMFASYNVSINRLLYIRSMFQTTIDHELLHMSSTVKGERYTHCGFCQIDFDKYQVFGEALNEGYTVLLDERYFADKTPEKQELLNTTYVLPKLFVTNLEDIIGKEQMEKWYFDGDLYSLIEEMCKYISFKRVNDFIIDLDIMSDYSINDEGVKGYRKIARAYEDAVSIITEMALYRLYYNYYEGNISIRELAEQGEAIKEYSQMVIGMTSQLVGRRIQTRPMKDRKFHKIAKKTSDSANKNVFK